MFVKFDLHITALISLMTERSIVKDTYQGSMKRCRTIQENLHIVFLDLEKAYDNVSNPRVELKRKKNFIMK